MVDICFRNNSARFSDLPCIAYKVLVLPMRRKEKQGEGLYYLIAGLEAPVDSVSDRTICFLVIVMINLVYNCTTDAKNL